MSNENFDLVKIFKSVTATLGENKQVLNQLDEYNQDHGDHMVNTFQTITTALQQKQKEPPANALAYASSQVKEKAQNGSGQLYAQGLHQAAQQLQGKNLDPQMAMQLLTTLIGGGQANPAASPAPHQQAGGVLGSLLGSLTGTAPNQSGGLNDGLDMGDLVSAGMAFMQSKQKGGNNLEAVMAAVTAANGMGSQPYRQKSTQLVAQSFLKALQGLGKK
jgi:hypothetical protein